MNLILQQIANALADGSLYALIALGYTMIYGVLRLINFAHGDVFMLGAFSGAFVGRAVAGSEQTLPQALLGMLLAMVLCGAIGYGIERVAYRPLRHGSRLSALITAIGVSLLIEYLAQIEWRVGTQTFFGPTPETYKPITGSGEPVPPVVSILHWRLQILPSGLRVSWKDVLVVAVTAVTLAVLWFVVQKTRTGKAMRAVSQNYDAARLMGIDLNRIISFTFVLGSVLAAIGGSLYGIRYGQLRPLLGVDVGLHAFVATVIGGIGNIPGAALGGLVLACVETLAAALGFGQYKDALAFTVLIAVLLVRPEGILGKPAPEKV